MRTSARVLRFGLAAIVVGAGGAAAAATRLVTNTADSGAGSLRQALLDAAAGGADNVVFNIPTTDPGYAQGVFTLRPATALPGVPAETSVDGTTQTAFTGDTNPLGPEVFLKGDLVASGSGLFISSDGSVIRGLAIGGFAAGDGVALSWAGGDLTPSNNEIRDCYVGTDPTGTTAVPNGAAIGIGGVASPSGQATFNVIANNLLSGNLNRGITLCDAADTLIGGNKIGTDRTGTTALGNGGIGILLTCAGAPRNKIENNVVAYNTGDGIVDAPDYRFAVAYTANGHQGNRITMNSIHSNGGLGIDLIPPPFPPTDPPSTPTLNDVCDVDAGGNLLQNFPVIMWADSSGGTTTIKGTLNSVADTTYRVELFASTSPDASGYGEGQSYLGFVDVTTGVDCNSPEFTLVVPGTYTTQAITATATAPGGNTSEFSHVVPTTPVELMSFTLE